MSAVATVLYLWAMLQDYTVAVISAVVVIAVVLGLWYIKGITKE